ncbi:MAG: glycoside hydrolase domain-containing protein [Phycisphaerae bacterium]
MRFRFLLVFACVLSVGSLVSAARPILNTDSPWRAYYAWGPEATGTQTEPNFRGSIEVPLPPPNWTTIRFDDSDWVRVSGPVFQGGGQGWGFGEPRNVLLSLRGKFEVRDPDAVGDLTLRLKYRGGVAVFINGREVARHHLPAGKLDRELLAEDYPKEVYRYEGGTIPRPPEWGGADHTERVNRRVRESGEITIPAGALREGTNVLALRFHPAAYRSDWADYAGDRASWSTIGVLDIDLQASGSGGITPNVSPPQGVQVWPANPLERIGETVRYPDPMEEAAAMRLVAPKNGVDSAKLVVSDSRQGNVPSFTVSATELESERGDRLPAGVLDIRYPGPGLQAKLSDRSSPAVALVTARVPADATAGTYTGALNVSVSGQGEREVPVILEVARWRAPSPPEFRGKLNMLQSPETIARHYGVQRWSDEHFRYMDPSLRLLGELGNNILYVNLIRHTHLGNEETIVRFRRRGGTLVPDFGPLRRYLRKIDEYAGQPDVLVLYLYEGGGDPVEPTVTQINPDGSTEAVAAPRFGGQGSLGFWKPVFDGIIEIVEEMGWSRDVLYFGVFGDSWSTDPQVQEFFERAGGGIQWAMFTHARGHPRPDGDKLEIDGWDIGYREMPGIVDFRHFHRSPGGGYLRRGHRQEFFQMTSVRGYLSTDSHPGRFLTVAEYAMTTESRRGVARIGLDFWSVDGGAVIGRYHRWYNLYRNNPRYITYPGPEGAVSSVRLEMLRQGFQENEAMILLDIALHDHADKLSDGLKQRIRELMVERLTYLAFANSTDDTWDWFAGSGWKQRSLRLYNLTAEAAEAIGEVVSVEDAKRWSGADEATATGPQSPPDEEAEPAEPAQSEDQAEAAAQSMVKLARNLHAAGLTESALQRLVQCMKEYPDTEAAKTAAELHEQWSSEQR